MSRRHEDFDEFCDPENPRKISYEEVIAAANRIKPHIVSAHCLESHCSKKFAIPLYYKLESRQKSGSFKERGALNALMKLPLDKKKLGVVVASLGNEGIAMSVHGHKLNIPVVVVMPNSVPLSHLQRCHALGAKVIVQGTNLAESMRYARAIARDKGLSYINGRDHPDVLAGYGTIALEILEELPNVQAVLVPVGTGGLASAVASVIKRIKPSCLVYGVQPEAAPLFTKTLENERRNEMVLVSNEPTLADSIAITALGSNSYPTAQAFLDKMLMVKEEWIARAMLHMFERQRLVVEGAGACPLAAIIGSLVPELKLKKTVAIITGGTVNNLLFIRSLERGLAVEGRLVKFRVAIKDTTGAQTQLLRLIASGGYSLERQFQTHRWIADDEYRLEMSLVCSAKSLEHALELKRIIERAYPCLAIFETEPFNDKRTCPCYVYKNVCAY